MAPGFYNMTCLVRPQMSLLVLATATLILMARTHTIIDASSATEGDHGRRTTTPAWKVGIPLVNYGPRSTAMNAVPRGKSGSPGRQGAHRRPVGKYSFIKSQSSQGGTTDTVANPAERLILDIVAKLVYCKSLIILGTWQHISKYDFPYYCCSHDSFGRMSPCHEPWPTRRPPITDPTVIPTDEPDTTTTTTTTTTTISPEPGTTENPTNEPTVGPDPTKWPDSTTTMTPWPEPTTDGPTSEPTTSTIIPGPGPTEGPAPGPTEGPEPGPTGGPEPGPTKKSKTKKPPKKPSKKPPKKPSKKPPKRPSKRPSKQTPTKTTRKIQAIKDVPIDPSKIRPTKKRAAPSRHVHNPKSGGPANDDD